ncbi:FAD dependent oxidoreductase [Capsaspora owczarzaki ATCC 30864]|nr:FAD dependent oxidoreductase [Capsaspora owczarzaki ATCC 30864]|eukprot:XP_004345258.2 FAD dependent oxidoreductase [Capsaspora owczarzaki ATCC 30864]
MLMLTRGVQSMHPLAAAAAPSATTSGLLTPIAMIATRAAPAVAAAQSKRTASRVSSGRMKAISDNPSSLTGGLLRRHFSSTAIAQASSTSSSSSASAQGAVPSVCDVLILGGGVVGSSTAYFTSSRFQPRAPGQPPAAIAQSSSASNPRVVVIEPDSSYASGATARSAGSIRLQFSTPENVLISQFGAHFLKNLNSYLKVDDDIDFKLHEKGYLFLATKASAGVLASNSAIQNSLGAKTLLLTPEAIRERFPYIHTEDLDSGALGLENEGWFDPYLLMTLFRRKAIQQGVQYVTGYAIDFKKDSTGRRVERVVVRLADGSVTEIGVRSNVVNASGIVGASLTAKLDPSFDLPVRPRKRFVYVLSLKERLPDNCPLVIDPSGAYFRPEGQQYICGMSPPENEDPDCTDLEVDYSMFENTVWPILASRVPAFEYAKCVNAWAGHYDYNTFDQNVILGPHPNVSNFLLCNGFSGHGLQQSPQSGGRSASSLLTQSSLRSTWLDCLLIDSSTTCLFSK